MSMLARISGSGAADADSLMRILSGTSQTTSSATTIRSPHAVIALQETRELSFIYEDDGSHGTPPGVAIVRGYVRPRNVAPTAEDLGRYLLASWRDRGMEFLRGLEGSYLLVLLDQQEDRLLVATDCLSSRSIWYAQSGGDFILGTDVRAIRELLPQKPALDLAYVWSFMRQACTMDNRSPFVGIEAMDAGVAWEFQAGVPRTRTRYIEPVFRPRHRPIADTAAELVDSLRQTIDQACLASRSPCLFLSGGLDSRLIAGVCPEGMNAITLCDRPNTEISVAVRIGRACKLSHRVIVREKDWYPSCLVPASLGSNGIWGWNEAHYCPLAHVQYGFDHDVAILGFGSNTYFKGNHLSWHRLWEPAPADDQAFEQHLLELVMQSPPEVPRGETVLRDGARQRCQEAYRAAALPLIGRLRQWASTVPDLWELFWCQSLTSVVQTYNLACLRDFTQERNAFSTHRIQQLYLSIPAEQRASGLIVRRALRHVGKRLNLIPDANTWVPAGLPLWAHRVAAFARRRVAATRAHFLNRSTSGDYASRGSWPHTGRLWFASPSMRGIMDELVDDDRAFPDELFDRAAIRRLWHDHCVGHPAHHTMLNVLATFGIFHRSLI